MNPGALRVERVIAARDLRDMRDAQGGLIGVHSRDYLSLA